MAKGKKVKQEVEPHAAELVDAHPAVTIKELRQVFRDAFETLGGAVWLVEFARKDSQNARTFVQALSRMIPLELTGKDGAPLTVFIQNADGTQVPVEPLQGEARRLDS